MSKTRVIVAGGRDFDDYELLKKRLDVILMDYENVEIVSGHAKGADMLGEKYAAEKGIPLTVFPADWKKYRIRAGFIRNSQMLEYACGETPLVVAFWDGESHGTKDTIEKAKEKDITVYIEKYGIDETGSIRFNGEWIVDKIDDYELLDYYQKNTTGKEYSDEEVRKIWGIADDDENEKKNGERKEVNGNPPGYLGEVSDKIAEELYDFFMELINDEEGYSEDEDDEESENDNN